MQWLIDHYSVSVILFILIISVLNAIYFNLKTRHLSKYPAPERNDRKEQKTSSDKTGAPLLIRLPKLA